MKLTVINKVLWKNVYLVLLDKDNNIIEKEKLSFDSNKKVIKDIDLNKAKYCYFTNDVRKTDIIILSTNLSILTLRYNRKTKLYKCDLYNEKQKEYGKVYTYVLKDEKNLFYRKDASKVVNIYVPSYYDPKKKYKVLIMFDSQNIYHLEKVGKYTTLNDPYGSWQVEASLENTKLDYIVVGIENADDYRSLELSFDKYSENLKSDFFENKEVTCHLDNLDDFINETLLPFVKERFNIDDNNMGVAGASCGGMASLYVGLRNMNKYNFIFTFTPAIGIIGDKSLTKLFKDFNFKDNYNSLPYVFFFQGNTGELEHFLHESNKNLVDILINTGYNSKIIDSYIQNDANHNEDPWRYAFNYAINVIKEKSI